MLVDSVRVRYAPSPTGIPHVGNIRTALFNWLFARHHDGEFIVRIEDTDVARTVDHAEGAILDSLKWLGMDWDEGPEIGGEFGPYYQSQRLDLYSEAAQRLLDQGSAYKCYCSPERLDAMRKEQQKRKLPPGYDRRCRDLTNEQRGEYEAQGIIPVVRFKMPVGGKVAFEDLIRGEVVFDASTIDDFVILKSDGFPTYHLASVVDDTAMCISHVLRADEWLSSTPRHILLYEALGYKPPEFAHLPMILGPDKSKLSKRHGATSIIEYREQGYLSEAMINFLALLGWALDDKTELMSRDELIRNFTIERVGKTGSIFNHDKLLWMNGVYMRKLSKEEFARQAMPFLEQGLPESVERPVSKEYLVKIAPLIQERTRFLLEVAELTEFFFIDELEYNSGLLAGKGLEKQKAIESLNMSKQRIENCPFDSQSLEEVLRPLAAELGIKTGILFGMLRVAVTGRIAAPPLFQTMEVLGKQRCLDRIDVALLKLS
jgi:glutamyl-tRNA synthetase